MLRIMIAVVVLAVLAAPVAAFDWQSMVGTTHPRNNDVGGVPYGYYYTPCYGGGYYNYYHTPNYNLPYHDYGWRHYDAWSRW